MNDEDRQFRSAATLRVRAHTKVMSELTEATANGDTEAAHMDADNALMEFVRALGFDDVAEAYDKVNKWYA